MHIAVAAGGGTPYRRRRPKLKKGNAEDIRHRFSSSRLGWHARSTATYPNEVFPSLPKIAGAVRRIFEVGVSSDYDIRGQVGTE
jgi:hypothetical protein